MADADTVPYQTSRAYFKRALQELAHGSDPATFAILSHRDGRLIVSCSATETMPAPAKLAAMTSALAALSATILREVSQDQQTMTLIEGKDGLFLVMPVHAQTEVLLLGTHACKDISLGRLIGRTRVIAAKIRTILSIHDHRLEAR